MACWRASCPDMMKKKSNSEGEILRPRIHRMVQTKRIRMNENIINVVVKAIDQRTAKNKSCRHKPMRVYYDVAIWHQHRYHNELWLWIHADDDQRQQLTFSFERTFQTRSQPILTPTHQNINCRFYWTKSVSTFFLLLFNWALIDGNEQEKKYVYDKFHIYSWE